MMLSGSTSASLLLEPSGGPGSWTLQPRTTSGPLPKGASYADGTVAGPKARWSPAEIHAAAQWLRDVAADREPVDERHVWFGGGVGFGRVTPAHGADFAIDVIVLGSTNAPLPKISYGPGSVEIDDSGTDMTTYITVDITAAQVAMAAKWFDSL